ncbi:MAG TPA: OmpA family protein [Gemmatimonadales bacterium]|nr:OmpA family protein [Gemmatimonadales bacterium]
MRTYPNPGAGLARALRLSGLVVSTLCIVSLAQAQDRRYLFELSAGAGYYGFGRTADLSGKLGGVGRLGVWLPYNLSLEAEGFLVSPTPKSTNVGVNVTAGSGSLLYNQFLGGNGWGYAKIGYGKTKYGGECVGQRICGTTTTLIGGIGTRIALTPIVLVRAEAVVMPNRGTAIDRSVTPNDTVDVRFTNYGLNIGVSVMLGSKPVPDSDGDGILNNRDRCAGTPAGAQVDGRGCPADTDGDGVANGVDRCPNTAVGALVDAVGCTHDSDGDNIADGIDKCPDTPTGVLVDSNGCPKDSDGDTIADGLDRCSDTPKGATVDALGCPGDEDADGVLDGLDRCPRTSVGANVNASGCVQGQTGRQPAAAPPAAPPPTPRPDTAAAPAGPSARPMGAAMVLENVTFGTGSARLQSGSYVELDSIAKVLIANPSLRVEIAGHTDVSASPADDMHLSNLRAEAVRNYLVARGVPYQQVVARGYGGTQPRTPDTTPRGRAANRRIELRPLLPAP